MFKQPKFWRSVNVISILLYPFSILYLLISKFRYHILQTPVWCEKKVICIGNVLLGGGGKTPLAIAVGEALMSEGFKVAYACRNYMGDIKTPMKVSESHSSSEVVDEALLLSKFAPTYIASKRLEANNLACESADVVIADDGLQNNTFFKDLSILVVPDDNSFGNGFIFPAGPLRESLLDGLKKADVVFMMNEKGKSHQRSRELIKERFDKKKVFNADYEYKYHGSRHKKYIAFAGIAYPDRFFDSLESVGVKVVEKVGYPDHYNYTEEEVRELLEKAKRAGAGLITTEKDLVKIDKKYHGQITYLGLKVHLLGKAREVMLEALNTRRKFYVQS